MLLILVHLFREEPIFVSRRLFGHDLWRRALIAFPCDYRDFVPI
jgi:hypothetical protein